MRRPLYSGKSLRRRRFPSECCSRPVLTPISASRECFLRGSERTLLELCPASLLLLRASRRKMKGDESDALCSVSLFRWTLFLMMPDFIFSFGLFPQPQKRFDRPAGVHFRVLDPMPETYVEYYPPDYEYGTAALELPDEEEYNVFDRYSAVPVYGYYAGPDVPDAKESEAYGIVEDRPPGDPIVDLQEEMMEEDGRKRHYYSVDPEAWVEGQFPRYEAPAAYPEDLAMTQAYGDAVDPRYGERLPFAHPMEIISPAGVGNRDDDDDGGDERQWYYGIPVTEVDESENAGREDDSVRELESLREKIRNPKKNIFRNQKTKARKDKLRNAESAPVSKDKIIQQLQKSIDSRKNHLPSEPLQLRKKQIYGFADPAAAKYFIQRNKAGRERTTGRKFPGTEGQGEAKKATEDRTTEAPSTGAPESPSGTGSGGGQKEFVLPRPASPARAAFDRGVAPRASGRTSLYDAIKRALRMEEAPGQREKFQVKKRFVLSEDQLMSELSGLKKTAL